MQFGFSSYSFYQHLRTGRMSLLEVIDWIGASDATHMEIATVSLSPEISNDTSTLDQDPGFVQEIKTRAADQGVTLSNLVVPADLLGADADTHMQRVKRHLDVAAELDITLFRHDVARWAHRAKDIADFEALLPRMVEVCQEIARYAAQYGITTSVENHGLLMNGGERVRRLIHLVGEPNFKTTLDVGNFMSVDDNPVVAVAENAPYASIVHLKDFYIRSQYPGEGWHHTPGGNYLLGSIVGYGDLDMRRIVHGILAADYDGFVSIEFEGIEECLMANTVGLANAKRLFAEVGVAAA
ncbi:MULTISPECIES: sugar phosphate isomerase/epimerase family protein [Micromonospora]|uniref:Sugar phosphate isomerase/epimerase n=1 Tax=Micromonospora yangpuensis TaxID=683228 RepID=A0A1C6V3A3_9ACTN|nr:sugar phosphate isomerase/epimerase family protein [Micromonospora yangpuensis]GGM15004.1 sugar phosphate isomerase [Micromonospora yangpuensis]SCL60842.1 Sugar phosphate isomerase/epimerase [Micromonospora yangpuensis]